MKAPFPDSHDDRQMTRRGLFTGVAASLISAPAIVPASSLMPVHSLILRAERPYAGFAKRLFYHSLWCALQSGQATTLLTNRQISESEAHRMVAHARAQGWLRTSSVVAVAGV